MCMCLGNLSFLLAITNLHMAGLLWHHLVVRWNVLCTLVLSHLPSTTQIHPQASKMNGWSGEQVSMNASFSSTCSTLKDALIHWADPDDPCAASESIMQVIDTYQVFPAWTSEAEEVLLSQVEQVCET